MQKMDGKLRTMPASNAQLSRPPFTPWQSPVLPISGLTEGSFGHIPRLTHSPARLCSTRWLLALLLALAALTMLIFCEEQTVWVRWMDINIYEHFWGKESIPKPLSCAGKCQLWKQGGKEMERFALCCLLLWLPVTALCQYGPPNTLDYPNKSLILQPHKR